MRKKYTMTLDQIVVEEVKRIAKENNDCFSNTVNRLLTEYAERMRVLSEKDD